MITSKSIEDVRQVPIEEIIGKYVELKRAGANYKGKSPFAEERTPSFIVSPAKQIFKCFSTGQGGDAIKFIMLHLGLSFIDAVKEIAKNHNVFLEQEQLSEEEIRSMKQKDIFLQVNEDAAREFQVCLTRLPEDHWAKVMIKSRGIDQDAIIDWQIGYAPGNLISDKVVKNATLAQAKELGLVRTKDGRNYDFFFNRLIFPIHNRSGRVIGFSGRSSNDPEDQKYGKYVNSPDSKTYNKSTVLFGLHLAARHIGKLRKVILVEGNVDVIALHQIDVNNVVATCGTALTEIQAKMLARLADEIILFRDGDAAGIRALHKDIDILLPTNKKISVVLCPDGEDPDSLAKKLMAQKTVDPDINPVQNFILKNTQDAVLWKAKCFKEEAGDSPQDKADALNTMVDSLMLIGNEITRNAYIKAVASTFKETSRQIKNAIKQKLSEANARAAKTNSSIDGDLLNGLPQGANIDEYLEKGYLTVGNNFWIRTNERWKKASNFKLTPLFHVEGNKDTVRIFDCVNEKNVKSLIELESNVLLNQNLNQNRLLDYDYYMWATDLPSNFFKLIMARLTKECIKVKPFDYFGWQSKGFWAYANGVFHDGQFTEVNKYGIITVEGLEEIDSDYYNNTPNYYSPAFNITNRFKEDNQDLYKNDRDYIYRESAIRFDEWMALYSRVYPHLTGIGIAFVISTCFRDFIGNRYNAFPHLFFTGEKESGKTAAALSLASIFTYGQKALDLNTSTMVGFSRRLERGKNTISVLEEYNDTTTDLKMKQAMKGAYDFRGREIGMMTNDNRTKSSNVYSSLVILSQFVSSWDDNSLTSRSSVHHFTKIDKFTDEQIDAYEQLKKYESEGITSLVLEIVDHRQLIEQHFHEEFNKNTRKFKAAIGQDYKDRVLMNFNILYTPVSILYKKFAFPFKLKDFFQECCDRIVENTDLITSTEGIAEFWSALQEIFNNNDLKEGIHYDLDTPASVGIMKRKGETEQWTNSRGDRVLYLKFNDVHGKYLDIVSRREGVDPIGKQTLINYFKGKKYFIGLVQSRRWTVKNEGGHVIQSHTTSAYAFNYNMLRNMINFEKDDRTREERRLEAIHDNPMVPDDGEMAEGNVEDLFTAKNAG